jgi:hypothetical protein
MNMHLIFYNFYMKELKKQRKVLQNQLFWSIFNMNLEKLNLGYSNTTNKKIIFT